MYKLELEIDFKPCTLGMDCVYLQNNSLIKNDRMTCTTCPHVLIQEVHQMSK